MDTIRRTPTLPAMHYVGIDPGLTGGAAILSPCGQVASLTVLPVADGHLHAGALARYLGSHLTPDSLTAVELVHAMPGQGVTSMFSFGETTGIILGVLGALGHVPARPTPQSWQKALGVALPADKARKGPCSPGEKADRRKAVKARALATARALLGRQADLLTPPRCRGPHGGLVDALLIAEWLRRQHQPEAAPWDA